MWLLLIGGFLLLDTSLQQEIGKHLKDRAGAGQGLGNGEPGKMENPGKWRTWINAGIGKWRSWGNTGLRKWRTLGNGGLREIDGLGDLRVWEMEDLGKWRTWE
jgi:hypothetical protein